MDWILKKMFLLTLSLVCLVGTKTVQAEASNRAKVKALYMSLVKIPPNKQEIAFLLPYIEAGNYQEAANIIIDPHNHGPSNNPLKENGSMGAFYSVNLQNMVSRWTNTEGSPQVPLNDMTATIMGQVKEERSFKKLFTDDIYYKATGLVGSQYWPVKHPNDYPSDVPNNVPVSKRPQAVCADVINSSPPGSTFMYYQLPDNLNDPLAKACRKTDLNFNTINTCKGNSCLYIPDEDFLLSTDKVQTINTHYAEFEQQYFDLSQTNILQRTSQMGTVNESIGAIAGIFSTRAFASAYYSAGTNRRAVAFAMKNFLCRDMEELNDTTVPDFRVRRDVDRAPGGDPTIFQNKCVGCHSGMDALAGAFAYYNFGAGALDYEEGVPVVKMNHNAVYPNGFVTLDDSFMNLWTTGKNSDLGFRGPASGNGARVFGQTITQSDAFDQCIVKQVADSVCQRIRYTIPESEYQQLISTHAANFRNHENLKQSFKELAIACTQRL